MAWLSRVARRLRGLVSRSGHRAIGDELHLHLDFLTEEYRAQGLSDREARLRAREDFGNLASVAERTRAVTTYPWLEIWGQDVRHSLVGLRRNPAFAAAALATLAIGIGATTAVFSVVYGMLVRPLPFVEPGTLVRVWEEHPGGQTVTGGRWLSHWTYDAWAGRRQTVVEFGGYVTWNAILRVDDQAFPAAGASLTPTMVQMVGPRLVAGRWFAATDAVPGAPRVVVLGHRLWQERFGSRPGVVGTRILTDDAPATIIGVAAPGMQFPSGRADCWRPYAVPTPAAEPRRTMGFNAVARLAPGITPAQVEAEGTAAARSVARPPSTNVIFGSGGPVVVRARPLAEDTVAAVRPALVALAVAVGLVLILACANVANLLLSRGVARQREFAIRRAIGASRGRLASQTVTETLVLVVGAGGLGTALAAFLLRALPAVAPQHVPRLDEVQLDPVLWLTATLVTVAAACTAGVLPALRTATVDAVTALRGGDGGLTDGYRTRAARRLRDGLLVAESAAAVVLLTGALLVGHSLVRLMHVDAGYTPDTVVTATFSMPRDARPARTAVFLDELLARLDTRPDVAAAGAANTMPMVPMTAVTSFPLVPAPGEAEVMTRSVTYVVTPGYAEALGLRLKAGRFFTTADQTPGMRAVLVNEEFIRRYLRGRVVGRRFDRLYQGETPVLTEIIGVVGNVLKDGPDQPVEPEIYFVHGGPAQPLTGYFSVAVRVRGEPATVIRSLRETAAEIDGGAVLERADRLSDRVRLSLAQPRFAAMVLGLLAALGLSLASVGLFAMLSYTVSQRRREIGVRAALGASRLQLLTLVLKQAFVVTTVGIALGLLLAAGLTRILAGLLFGVTPLDPVSFLLAPVVLVPVALAASLVPALRAAATAPAIVLRSE